YNFGFSGCGKLETAVVDLIAEIEAKIYIIDCMPNLQNVDSVILVNRIVTQIKRLREKRPTTPIILTDHLGYPHSESIRSYRKDELNANNSQKKAFEILIADGVKDLYHLDYNTLAMPMDATVEAVHPSDWGMQVYADAYEKMLRDILSEPIGNTVTTVPVRQRREPNIYEWLDRHEKMLSDNKTHKYKGAFLGNSIFHHWGGVEGFAYQRGADSWDENFSDYHNHGFGFDRIENVLWRIYHDEFTGISYKKIILKIGTNNISVNNTDEQIVQGIEFVISALQKRQGEAEIKVLGILPRRNNEPRVKVLNEKIKAMVSGIKGCKYQDVGGVLLLKNGKINEKMFVDGLHPNKEGYKLIVNEGL
ncbi:MAG: SGNH/GDSL hydrolase family protein, partial [Rikenellaceae bacterium]